MIIASGALRSRVEWKLLMTMEPNIVYGRYFLVYAHV